MRNKEKVSGKTLFFIIDAMVAPSMTWNRSKYQFIWYLFFQKCAYKCMYTMRFVPSEENHAESVDYF